MEKVISGLGVVAAVTFAVAPQFGAVQPKTAAWLVLIGTAVSAASGALTKYGESNKTLTGIGVVVAVAAVIAGATDLIPSNVTMIFSVIGTAVAAVGKSLFNIEPDEPGSGGSAGTTLLLIGVLGLAAGASGCDKSKQLAATTDRVAGYVAAGLTIVERQTTTGEMSTETGAVIVNALDKVNTLNKELIAEARNYQTPDGGLALTESGKAKLLTLLGSGKAIATNLVNDPTFLKLPVAKRQEVALLIQDLTNTITAAVSLVEAIQTKGGK
jgi:hypothetical protein